jgi:NAD(P)-dependent dehydrogenase (short-subunit alcohol dehydrogenase family)
MTVDLKDKVVIITGAGGIIGHAMALDFARNGAKVVASGRTPETLEKTVKEIAAAGGEATVIQADVGDKASAAALIEQTIKKYNRLDVLINNAGINGGPEFRKKIYEYSDDLWERIINTDLNGVYYCSKPAVAMFGGHPVWGKSLTNHIPQHRSGIPEDMSSMALFLSSDEASYITGSLNIVDGGWICGDSIA